MVKKEEAKEPNKKKKDRDKGMKLQINVSQDKELRTFIKNLIREQHKAVIRFELEDMFSNEVKKKLENMEGESEQLFERAVKKYLATTEARKWLQGVAKEYFKDRMETAVEKQIGSMVRTFLDHEVRNAVDEMVYKKIKNIKVSV